MRTRLRIGRCLSVVALVVGCATVAGCGRSKGSVSGVVTFNGKPLSGGNVVFVSTDGGASNSSAIGDGGKYSIPVLLSGAYKVVVETKSLQPPAASGPPGMPPGKGSAKGGPPAGAKPAPPPGVEMPPGYKGSSQADMATGADRAKNYTKIPDQYEDSKTTPLTFTAAAGDQTFNIDLK